MTSVPAANGSAAVVRTAGARDVFNRELATVTAALGVFLAVSQASAPLAAALFLPFFLLRAWARPRVALAMIFASAPFQNDVSFGGPLRFSLAELCLVLALPLCVMRNSAARRGLRLGPVGGWVGLYLITCAASSLLHLRGSDAAVSMFQMVLYLIVGVTVFASFAGTAEDYELSLLSLVLMGAFLGAAALVTRSGYVLGLHKNGLGASLAAALVVAVELWVGRRQRTHPRLLMLATFLITGGLIFSLSRGAWMAAAVGIVSILGLHRQLRMLSRLLLVIVPLAVAFWLFLPASAKEQALNFNEGSDNVRLRRETVDACRAMFKQSPILGMGTGVRKEIDATNILWVTLAETGLVGLAALALVHVAILWMLWGLSHRMPRSDPRFSYLAICGALVLGRLTHGFVDHYWSRGAITAVWASVGMATFVYYTVVRPAARRVVP